MGEVSPQARGDLDKRLPTGRHGLTREQVIASQRGRLLIAMATVVNDKGYAQTTVADVVEHAAVSKRTFYELFTDKQQCFLEMYDTGVEIVLGRMRDAVMQVPGADWRTRLRKTTATYTEILAGEPAYARATHIEILSAGPEALARRAAILEIFKQVWKRFHLHAREEDPSLPELPDAAYATMTAGLEDLVREQIRSSGPESLPEIAETLYVAAAAIFSGR